MNNTSVWPRALLTFGYIAMLVGAIDPIEGALIILPGSGMVLLGTYLGNSERRLTLYRLGVFAMVIMGVIALVGLTMHGGFGGPEGLSVWWGMLVLPYLLGWSMGIWGPESPRWVLWLGLVVAVWYLAILWMTLQSSSGVHESNSAGYVLGIIGIMTIIGCLYRLSGRSKTS